MENKITIPGLYEAAYRASSGTSFSPEKRAQTCVIEFEQELNTDLQRIPQPEQQRYIDGYKKHLFSWLSAKSNCISTMIAGPSNFPVRRAEKANRSENNRFREFVEWRNKALNAISKKVHDAKPLAQKNNERWEQIKRRLVSSMQTIVAIDSGVNNYSSRPLFVSSITGTVKTLAKNADVEMVSRCLDLIKEWNEKAPKPVITAKNSIWNLIDECEINRERMVDRENTENSESEINGVKVVKNFSADRIQLFFDGKPAPDMIANLKKKAFKWAPSYGCWQRQLTSNAVYAVDSLLK